MKSISHISEYMNILLSTLTTAGSCNTYAWDRSLPLSMNETRARYIFFKAMWDEYVAMYVGIHIRTTTVKAHFAPYVICKCAKFVKPLPLIRACVHICLYSTVGKFGSNIRYLKYVYQKRAISPKKISHYIFI